MKPLKIRAMLVERGLIYADIARPLGISRQAVSAVIHGRIASRTVAEEVARRIDLPLEKVFPRYKKAA
jgi:predicted transcriptional regulator